MIIFFKAYEELSELFFLVNLHVFSDYFKMEV
jgi:hypothetical protein